jgi:predicted restriction endonuclease
LEKAFAELPDNCIDFNQYGKFEPGAIVYIYCTPDRAVKFKCTVLETNIPYSETIDDRKYELDKEYFKNRKKAKNYMRLQLCAGADKDTLKYQYFKNFGLTRTMNIQQTINNDLSSYFETVFDNLNDSDTDLKRDLEDIESQRIGKTEKSALSIARIGQEIFRERVIAIDKKCPVTGVDDPRLLIASHIKSWEESNSIERLDGNNGILLSPHLDKLFDKHLISFSDDGKIIVRNKDIKNVLAQWHIDTTKQYVKFSKNRIKYLEYHRKKLLA